MTLEERKKKVSACERKLDDALRRQTIAITVVNRWRSRSKTQQRALMKELEEIANLVPSPAEIPTRRFR